MNGSSAASKTSVYLVVVMIPVKMTTAVAPSADIPAHTCTFGGCLGLKTIFEGSPRLWYVIFRCDSNCTEHSSVYITSLNLISFDITLSRHHSIHFSLFTSLISWQYLVLFIVHPRSRRALMVIDKAPIR